MSAQNDASPQSIIVSMRSSVTSSESSVAGRRTLVLHDDETGKFFHLGSEESMFISLVDGSLTVEEITEKLRALGVNWGESDYKAFLSLLIKSALVQVVSVDGKLVPPVNSRELPPPKSALQRAMTGMSLMLSQRIPLGNADRMASLLLPFFRPFLSTAGLFVWAVAVASALWIAWGHSVDLADQVKRMFSPASLPLLACIGIVTKLVHELGHAVAAKRLGVRAGSLGITLFLMAPLAYVDLTNAWKLSSRWQRIQIAIGGVYFESWLAIVATFVFAMLDDGLARHFAAQVMLIAGPATWFTNANPLLRLDGYYVVSDACGIPNLRMHGRKFWASLIDRAILKKPFQASLLFGWRVPFAATHAAASMGFQCVWMSGLVVAVWYWTSAIGAILATVAVISWVAMPIAVWWIRHWFATPTDPMATKQTRRRMLGAASMALFLLSTILSARNPFAHGVPVLVQHHNEQIGRASTDGFVTAVLVHGNQVVRRGDLMVEITDEKLVLRRAQMSDDLQTQLTKYRQLLSSGQLAEAEAANEIVKQLRQSTAELDQSIAAMRIVAIRDGVVISEQPERWFGRYAKRGDVLVRVAEPDEKELLVAIQEGDYSAYDQAVQRGRTLDTRIRGGGRVTVEPMAAHPRFSQTLPHPAMAATHGGDVTVVPDADAEGGVRSAAPIGTAIAKISPAQSLDLYAGQRGTLYLDDDQTIYTRLKHWLLQSPGY